MDNVKVQGDEDEKFVIMTVPVKVYLSGNPEGEIKKQEVMKAMFDNHERMDIGESVYNNFIHAEFNKEYDGNIY